MSDISTEELKKEINAILKTADLTVISAKKVREQIEKKLKCSLVSRKKEIDRIVMDFIDKQNDDDDENDDNEDDEGSDENKSDENKSDEPVSASEEEPSSDEEDDEEEEKKPKKRPQPTTRKAAPKKKRKSLNASDSGTESDGGSDSDYEQPKKVPIKKKGGASGGGTGTGTGRKSTGFTRPYNLSPELSALMGAEALPRHEVVKKIWAMIKERNLYDPKNKQFAICDDELLKVMGVKRFRTFAMLKYLKPHFLK